jgi:hypothetical protein
MRWRNAHMVCLAGAAALAAGCASRPAARPALAPTHPQEALSANQGHSWEVVLSGAATPAPAGPELARLDPALGRESESILAESAWPDPRADRLDRLRSVFILDDARRVHYYRAVPSWHSHRTRYRGW